MNQQRNTGQIKLVENHRWKYSEEEEELSTLPEYSMKKFQIIIIFSLWMNFKNIYNVYERGWFLSFPIWKKFLPFFLSRMIIKL